MSRTRGAWQLFRALTHSDYALKLLFDHVRNFGICAAVFAAASWQLRHLAPVQPMLAFGYFVSAALVVFGAFLFFANQWHGMQRLKGADVPQWLVSIVYTLYAGVSIDIIFSLARLGG